MPESLSLNTSWLCEAVRLRELRWGPLDDRAARLRAQANLTDLGRVATRAKVLGGTLRLPQTLRHLSAGGAVALIITLAVAMIAGGGSVQTALGSGAQPVNVVLALIVLLGVNTLSLIGWCLGMIWRGSGGWLPQAWKWLAHKLVHGPEVVLAGQAWWSLWQQAGSARWVLSSITHAIWLAANIAAVTVMLVMFSTRHFSFVWETTLLSPEVFVTATHVLGVVPHWFGFLIPDADTVRASGHVASVATHAQVQWAGWLLGTLTLYGLAPRALLLTLSLGMVLRTRSRTQPDLSSPYYVAVLARMPSSAMAPDGELPAQSVFDVSHAGGMLAGSLTQGSSISMLTGIELDPAEDWPPAGLGSEIVCTPSVDSRESRGGVLVRVAQIAPARLAIACDARHTPDRGTMRLVAELASFSGHTLIWLRHADLAHAHVNAWQTQIEKLPGVDVVVTNALIPVSHWLGKAHV